MEPEQANAPLRLALSAQFEGHDVAMIELEGAPFWSARQIAEALEYSRADRLVSRISEEWSTELVEHTDYLVLRGEALAALKAAAPGLVAPRAPTLLLLTESGVHLVALLSRQPAAARLRRWLASEVLPASSPGPTCTPPTSTPGAARGWLVQGEGDHVGPKRQIGRRGVRCVVFTRAAVERVPPCVSP